MANAVADVISGKSAIKIIVDLVSQDSKTNSSVARVRGQMINKSETSSTSPGNDIGRSVFGFTYWDGPHFGFAIASGATFNFIDQKFTIKHASDGTLTFNASVQYGETHTTLFLANKSIGLTNIAFPTIVPAAPVNLTFSKITSDSLTLSWDVVDGATGYSVNQWNNIGGSGTPTKLDPFSNSIDIFDLTPGGGYRFEVLASNSAGNSAYSDPATITMTKAPSSPSVPTFTKILATTVTVNWTKPSDTGNTALTGYIVSRYDGTDTSGLSVDTNVSASALSLDVSGLIPGSSYTFTVTAKNDATDNNGLSAPSSPGSVMLETGAWIRVDGMWRMAIPYIREGGAWRRAMPYVRSGSVWKPSD